MLISTRMSENLNYSDNLLVSQLMIFFKANEDTKMDNTWLKSEVTSSINWF